MPKIFTPDQSGLEIKRVGAGKLISIDASNSPQIRRFRNGYVPPSDPYWSSVQFLQGFNSLTDGTPVAATLPNAKTGGTVSFTTLGFPRWEISSVQSAGGGKSALVTSGVTYGVISAATSISGAFTFEASIYIGAAYDSSNVAVFMVSNSTGNISFITPSTSGSNWSYYAPSLGVVEFSPFATNAWNHFAITRDSSNLIRLFFNGTFIVSFTDANAIDGLRSAFYSRVGGALANTFYNDEIRATVGVCRYTASYTPSFPFPTQ
jgi:hypothetical protein